MAPRKSKTKGASPSPPRKRERKRAPPPPVPPENLAAACLHLLGLAAAREEYGLTLVACDADGLHEPEPDPASLVAIAKATKILLADRERLRVKATKALAARLHGALVPLFERAKVDADAMENLEDAVEHCMRDLGYTMTAESLKAFRVDLGFFHEHKGASQAAAQIIGKVVLGRSRRRVYGAQADAKVLRIPGPLNRHVPLPAVRRYFEDILATAEAHRRPSGDLLPVEGLDGDVPVEVLLGRVEAPVKELWAAQLDAGHEEMAAAYLALMRGEGPAQADVASPEIRENIERAREELPALAKEWLSVRGLGPDALGQLAGEMATWLIRLLKARLGAA